MLPQKPKKQMFTFVKRARQHHLPSLNSNPPQFACVPVRVGSLSACQPVILNTHQIGILLFQVMNLTSDETFSLSQSPLVVPTESNRGLCLNNGGFSRNTLMELSHPITKEARWKTLLTKVTTCIPVQI